MKKKGFTLIELLAVIVILAVIAVIATPAVLNIIEDSKKSAAEASARNIVSSAKTYYMKKIMEGESVTNVDLSSSTLKYDGEQATKGLLSYDKSGNAYGKMYISGYCVEIASDGTITNTKTDESECDISSTGDNTNVTKIYENGEVVYYNPETNAKCSNNEAVSATGTKTGCMKWYAFNDNGSNIVNLLLDHNTRAYVTWASYGNQASSQYIKNQLESDTETWNKSINARLIEANEIAKITNNTTWTAGGSYYYFYDNTQTVYKGAVGTNKYAWLFDNTNSCTTYGCNVADSSNYGYWTGTAYSNNSDKGWLVDSDGYLDYRTVVNSSFIGIRPVITVDKNILK